MDAAQIQLIEEAALISLQAATSLWQKLRDQNPTLPSVAEIVDKANKTADDVIKKADNEIAKVNQAVVNP